MDFLKVDGSSGEGGGQILRMAVAFSAALSVPVKVTNIRSGRRQPGLKPQHAAALRILRDVFDADLLGDSEGSTEVEFTPGTPRQSSVSVDMKTAASVTLVLQAVVPAVSLAERGLHIELTGGTDVPWAPTLDYFSDVAAHAYRKIGIGLSVKSSRRGYYPVGGGHIEAAIEPSAGVVPLRSEEVAGPAVATIVSRASLLPREVAERQAKASSSLLARMGLRSLQAEVSSETSASPGTSILVRTSDGGRMIGGDSIGERGKPAEEVGEEAAMRYANAVKSGASIDSYVADMVIPLLSLAKGESFVRVPEATMHLKTGLDLAAQFTGCKSTVEKSGPSCLVRVSPS